METIAEYHEKINLQKEIDGLKEQLRKAIGTKEDWRRKYWKIAKKHGAKKPLTRSDKALALIEKAKPTNNPLSSISDIAEKCHLSEGHVNNLWYLK